MEHPDPVVTITTDLKPCAVCGRTFLPDALTRHQRVCERNAAKKRKVFDSSKQRALPEAPQKKQEEQEAPKKAAPTKVSVRRKGASETKPNWRVKHEELIENIQKAKGKEENKKKAPAGYVECGSCGRHFNQRAAERHIPWCQQKKSETPHSQQTAATEAKEKLIARVRYRPPQGRSRHRKTKTADSVSVTHKPPTVVPVVREKAIVRSSPPNLVDKRNNNNNRNASLDRINNNNNNNNMNGNARRRSGSRSREKASSPDLPAHIIKFKERFPNSKKKRNGDLEESLTSEQLRDLLSCSRITERCPRTVPGVRLNNWNLSNSDVIRSASSSGDSSDSWNKRSVVRPTLPEVSSSEWARGGGKMCWNGDLSDSACSTGSSSGSLPPLSRESGGDDQHCHQCSSRFPLVAAKYCCECGARRRVCINQTG